MTLQALGFIGCGKMGTGLVEAAAVAGFEVVAVKATPGRLDGVTSRIAKSMGRAVAGGKLTPEARDQAMARIVVTADMGQLAVASLVVESTIESLADKQRILSHVERLLPPSTILASNTSSVPLVQLAAVLERPQRFLGLHFFSPAHRDSGEW
jgi:3-hydroxybutyryl-CoA dehydrogenase